MSWRSLVRVLAATLLAGCGAEVRLDGATSVGGTGSAPTSTSIASSSSSGGAGGAGAGGSAAASIVDACVIASSCGTMAGWTPMSASRCVDAYGRLGWSYDEPEWLPDPQLAARLLACATSADCAAVTACFGGDWLDLGRCREGGSCQDNNITSDAAVFDCGTIGGTCVNLWSNGIRACCNATPCTGTEGPFCTGTVASYCGGWGERVDFDCGPSSRVCQPDVQAPCAGTGAACDWMTPITCSGSVATYCSGGALAQYDCAKTTFRTACNEGQQSYMTPCHPQGSDCDPSAQPAGCMGDSVPVCVNGNIVAVSCPSLGFTTCSVDASGNTRCVP